MKEMVRLTKTEQRRLMVLNGVEVGRIAMREASEVLGLSLRHVRRILACCPSHWRG
jgi:predicted HTH domain antitoxin